MKPKILVSDVFTNLRDTAREYFHNPNQKSKNDWEKALVIYKKSDSTLIKSSKIRCYVCGKMIVLSDFSDHVGI